jgi:protein-disulfide isomerase/uncharacterized membrane protein
MGLGISIYQTVSFIAKRSGTAGSFQSFCTFGAFNCDAIEMSRWAETFPGIPLSSWAIAFFAATAVFSLLARSNEERPRHLAFLAIAFGLSSIISVIYLFIMRSVIGTWCLLCLGVDAINIASLAIVLSLKPSLKSVGFAKLRPNFVMMGTFVAISLVLSFLGKPPSAADDTDLYVQRMMQSAPLPVTTNAEYPSLGTPGAPITIVKFSDFQCPWCKRGALAMHALLDRYPGSVRYVFRNFPLDSGCNRKVTAPMHPASCEAAKVAICAQKLGRFKEVYSSIFEHQDRLKPGLPTELAEKAGLEPSALRSCLESAETKLALERDIEEAILLNVQGTPSFFFNGHKSELVPDLPTFSRAVEILSKKSP